MYNVSIFEKAIQACGYRLDRIQKKNETVSKAEGRIYYTRKLTLNGEVKVIGKHQKVRWNAAGHCFSLNNRRLRDYDLPLNSIKESEIIKQYSSCM